MSDPTPLAPRRSVSRQALVFGAAVILGVGAVSAAAAVRFAGPTDPAPTVAPAGPAVAGASLGTDATVRPAGAPSAGAPSAGTGLGSRRGQLSSRTNPNTGPAKLLGSLDPSAPVNFSLALKMGADGAIERYLDELYDPSSPNYRHFLTAAEFGAAFGQSEERIQALQGWAVANGFEVLASYDQRTAIRLTASAATVTKVFGVHLGNFVDPGTGAEFHAPLDASIVPPAISDAVIGLAGLDNRPVRSSAVRHVVGSPRAAVPPNGLGPVELANAYDIVPIYEAGILGDGQTIAIISFDTYTPSDIDKYDKEFGIDGPPVKKVAVGQPLTKPGSGTVEVVLDLEVVRGVAPHAQILSFEGKNGTIDQADIIDAIVQDGRADIVSDSWGRCDVDEAFDPGSRERGVRSLQAAAAAGVSVFVASGDHGAFDCWSHDPSDHRLSVDYPSASPYTIAVGGTQLNVRMDGSYWYEDGWQDYLSVGGSGGGNNPIEARPDWQVGPGVDNEFSNGKRQSPDVAASASTDSPYLIFVTDPDAGAADWQHIGGTSAASPFWAASMLLIRQIADQQGVGRLGYVNPMLYALANGPQRSAIFHDIVRGGNLQHPATPGWDYATGLGSADVTALAGAIVEYLRANPAGD